MSKLIAKEYQSFEQIKKIDDNGNEYWLARDLVPALEYTKWGNFQKVIDRAMLACQNSGIQVFNQFAEVGKLIQHGKGGKRRIPDYKLSRYACYLIVQNGDPRKEVIATGQTYFAIQTRNIEVSQRVFNNVSEKFHYGKASSLEVTQASTDFISAQNAYIQALVDMTNAQIALRNLLNK